MQLLPQGWVPLQVRFSHSWKYNSLYRYYRPPAPSLCFRLLSSPMEPQLDQQFALLFFCYHSGADSHRVQRRRGKAIRSPPPSFSKGTVHDEYDSDILNVRRGYGAAAASLPQHTFFFSETKHSCAAHTACLGAVTAPCVAVGPAVT